MNVNKKETTIIELRREIIKKIKVRLIFAVSAPKSVVFLYTIFIPITHTIYST